MAIIKSKRGLLLCLVAIAILLGLYFRARPGKTVTADPIAGSAARDSSGSRPHSDTDTRVKEAIAEYKKTERPKFSDAAPYHLSAAEIEKFLQARGRSAASLFFALLCSEDRKLLEEIAALPESPLKLQILITYHTDKQERLVQARKYVEIDPDNKIAHLMLGHALSELGLREEAMAAQQKSASAPEIRSGRDELAAEFKAACGILGEDRGYQMLENRWADYAVNAAHRTAHGYMASLDPAAFIHDGEVDVPLMLGKVGDFYRSIGFDEDRSHESAMMMVRGVVVNMKTTHGITNANFEVNRLQREMDAEFIAGFRRLTAFNKLTPEQRNQRLAETYFSGFE